MGVIKKPQPTRLVAITDTPVQDRTYRGFTYSDLERYGVEYSRYGRIRLDVLEEAYYKLFPKLPLVKTDPLWLRLMIAYELQRWLIYANVEPVKLKARRVNLRTGKIPGVFRFGESGDEDEAAKIATDKSEVDSMVTQKEKKEIVTSHYGGKRRKIFGHSVREALLWFGANGYKFKEAAAVLDALKIEATWGTIKATVSNGRNNEGNKYGEAAPFTRPQIKLIKELIPNEDKPKATPSKKAPAKKAKPKKAPPLKSKPKKVASKKAPPKKAPAKKKAAKKKSPARKK